MSLSFVFLSLMNKNESSFFTAPVLIFKGKAEKHFHHSGKCSGGLTLMVACGAKGCSWWLGLGTPLGMGWCELG